MADAVWLSFSSGRLPFAGAAFGEEVLSAACERSCAEAPGEALRVGLPARLKKASSGKIRKIW